MRCVECACKPRPNDRGWVLVLTAPTDPRIAYCPECLTALLRDATGEGTPAPGADAQNG